MFTLCFKHLLSGYFSTFFLSHKIDEHIFASADDLFSALDISSHTYLVCARKSDKKEILFAFVYVNVLLDAFQQI